MCQAHCHIQKLAKHSARYNSTFLILILAAIISTNQEPAASERRLDAAGVRTALGGQLTLSVVM